MTALTDLDTWLRDAVKDADEVSVAALRTQAYDHFASDQGWLAQMMEEAVYGVILARARKVVASTRKVGAYASAALTRDAASRSAAAHKVFRPWLEHVGGRHMRLDLMTSADLLMAAGERRARGSHEIKLALAWEEMAGKLDGDERVGDKFSHAEIGAILAQARSIA